MKVLIILYFVALAVMIAMIPYKLLTSVESRCPRCSQKVFYSKRKREFCCPHCGAEIIKDGLPVSPPR